MRIKIEIFVCARVAFFRYTSAESRPSGFCVVFAATLMEGSILFM